MNTQQTLFTLPESNEREKNEPYKGKRKLKTAVRNQIEFVQSSLDDLLDEDHEARNIWAFVDQMDLSPILNKIESAQGGKGRSATDPKILLAIWIYAITQGIGSARMIDRYCREHLAFKWLCGGVETNYHTISDFRRNNGEEFDILVAEFIAQLMDKELITLKRVSQDGCKVRASAGTSSFRRKPRLKELLVTAKEQVAILRAELDEDPAKSLNRQQAAKKRSVEERKKRVEQAIKEHTKSITELSLAKKKQRKIFTQKEKAQIRSSPTDPEARKMKMSNGGFNPAYNMQMVIDTESRFIVGYKATNKCTDYGQMSTMFNTLKNKFTKTPQEYLVDQGYLVNSDIITLQKQHCKVYLPPKMNAKSNGYEIREDEDAELIDWRKRMGMDESKEIYKDRAATSEWANAGMRNRGLTQLFVRGIKAVSSVLGLHVLCHNILRAIKLNINF